MERRGKERGEGEGEREGVKRGWSGRERGEEGGDENREVVVDGVSVEGEGENVHALRKKGLGGSGCHVALLLCTVPGVTSTQVPENGC